MPIGWVPNPHSAPGVWARCVSARFISARGVTALGTIPCRSVGWAQTAADFKAITNMGNQDLGNEIELSRVAEKTLKHACANAWATFSYINTGTTQYAAVLYGNHGIDYNQTCKARFGARRSDGAQRPALNQDLPCQSTFDFRLPSVIIPDRCETFRIKYESCNNTSLPCSRCKSYCFCNVNAL